VSGRRRRGHGEGAIYERPDGRWTAAVELGWQGGKRRRKYVYGRTRREVAQKLRAVQRAQQDGGVLADERTTVERYLIDWLAVVKPSLRWRTWQRYEQYARLHAIPGIGRVRLSKLTPQHLQGLYADRLRAGLSPTSVLHLHRLMHRALGQAVRWNLVPRNVADLVDPPRMPRYEHAAFTPEQAERFLAAIRGDRLEALFVLALVTGLREGELLGLRWSDVDLDAGTVTVRGAMQPDERGRRVIDETKTRSSRRLVVLPRLAVAAMLRHRTVQARERLRAGSRWEELGLVFPNTVGRAILPQNLVQRSLYPLLERAGLPRLRFHDLRHSAATLLLARGVHPKVVSELLGHAQIGITLDLYSHVSATMLRHAADAFDALFGGQLGGQAGSVEDKAAGRPS
jgi:integrase